MKETASLALIILVAGILLGFGGGYYVRGLSISEITDTIRVEVPVYTSVSVLDSSRRIEPEIRYITKIETVEIRGPEPDDVIIRAHQPVGISVAVLDTTLTRVEIIRDSSATYKDTIHVEYYFPPISRFVNLSVRPQPFVVPFDTVMTREIVTGSNIFHDAKVFLIGAGTALAVIKIAEAIRGR